MIPLPLDQVALCQLSAAIAVFQRCFVKLTHSLSLGGSFEAVAIVVDRACTTTYIVYTYLSVHFCALIGYSENISYANQNQHQISRYV